MLAFGSMCVCVCTHVIPRLSVSFVLVLWKNVKPSLVLQETQPFARDTVNKPSDLCALLITIRGRKTQRSIQQAPFLALFDINLLGELFCFSRETYVSIHSQWYFNG